MAEPAYARELKKPRLVLRTNIMFPSKTVKFYEGDCKPSMTVGYSFTNFYNYPSYENYHGIHE